MKSASPGAPFSFRVEELPSLLFRSLAEGEGCVGGSILKRDEARRELASEVRVRRGGCTGAIGTDRSAVPASAPATATWSSANRPLGK